MNNYKKTQFGLVTFIITMSVAIIIVLTGMLYETDNRLTSISLMACSGVLLMVTLLFHSLTVEVTKTHINLSFGIGVIKRQFEIKEIEKVRPMKVSWYTGWGIRLGKGYTLYNVSGFDAIELTFKNGRRTVRIGTEEPDELAQAINSRVVANSNAWR